MANNNKKAALESFKQQAASEVGVTLNQGYNGDLTARQAGSIGGQMVNIMTTVQLTKEAYFERENRIVDGHKTTVTYKAKVTAQIPVSSDKIGDFVIAQEKR